MNKWMLLLAQGANSPINKWLNEHPAVLGVIAILIGAVLASSGVYELRKGVAHDKHGNEIPGGRGTFTSILRIVAGVAGCGFGLYKMFAG